MKKIYKLEDIAKIVAGGTPSTKIEEYWNGDIPWITPKDLSNYSNRYISHGERWITELGLQNSSAILMPKNAILFTSRAPIGYIAIARNQVCTNQGFKSLICNEKICDYKFIYYWLLNNIEKIKEKANGSTFLEISGTTMKKIEIVLPSLKVQKQIAKILDNIDSKIELNNHINDNLYEIAKAIYRNELILDNEIKIKVLEEYCNIFTGKKNANQYDENGQNLFFTCGQKPLKINSFIFDGPAIIISGNGAYTGRTLFYNGKFDLYQRTYACTINDNDNVDYIYGLYIIVKEELINKINGGTHGSAIPYIVMNDLAKFKIKYSEESIKSFSKKVKPILENILNNERQNESLEQLRDTLLPKLMNGEIELDKVEDKNEVK